MKIIIADPLPSSAADLLRAEGWSVDARAGRSPGELQGDLAAADGLIVRSATRVDADLLAAAPRLRVVARAGTGVDNIDLDAASRRGILVLNAPGVNSISVAEHALALMLALARSVPRADASMKVGRWEKKALDGAELRGKCLGVLGLGRIGREVVRRALAFEMRIVAHDPYISAQIADDLSVELVTLDGLCAEADYISLHLPSTAGTRGLFDAARLARCKRGVRIVNTARGDLLDEAALAAAIGSGQVAGAGLDVFETEPPGSAALTGLPQVVATPHIAASTREAQELVGLETATCVREFLRAGVVRNAVNFPSVTAEEFRRLQPFVGLAERLGSFLAQLAEDRIEVVGIRYYGELAHRNHDMLVGAVLVGLFRTMLSSTVTLVNARSIAQQRGLEIVESHSTRPAQLHESHLDQAAYEPRRALGGRRRVRAAGAAPRAARRRRGRGAPRRRPHRHPQQRPAGRHRRGRHHPGPASAQHRHLRARPLPRRRGRRGQHRARQRDVAMGRRGGTRGDPGHPPPSSTPPSSSSSSARRSPIQGCRCGKLRRAPRYAPGDLHTRPDGHRNRSHTGPLPLLPAPRQAARGHRRPPDGGARLPARAGGVLAGGRARRHG